MLEWRCFASPRLTSLTTKELTTALPSYETNGNPDWQMKTKIDLGNELSFGVAKSYVEEYSNMQAKFFKVQKNLKALGTHDKKHTRSSRQCGCNNRTRMRVIEEWTNVIIIIKPSKKLKNKKKWEAEKIVKTKTTTYFYCRNVKFHQFHELDLKHIIWDRNMTKIEFLSTWETLVANKISTAS